MSQEAAAIHLEFTPNPNTLKFVTNKTLLDRGAVNYPTKDKLETSPLVAKLFGVPGVSGVLVGSNFVTVTKSPDGSWDVVAEEVPKVLEVHLNNNEKIFADGFDPNARPESTGKDAEIENKIRDVLDQEIRPAVAMDGGDITFGKFENGIVYLHLQGSCSSCPSSIATLKMGVETRLKEVIPEVKEVVQV